MVIDPITIFPDATLADALALMRRAGDFRHSGGRARRRRQAGAARRHPHQPRRALRRRSAPAGHRTDDAQGRSPSARGSAKDEARRLLHQHRIEKLVVVDEDERCVGLITVKDIEKATAASPRRQGRATGACASPRRPPSATRASTRAELLMAAGVDCLVVDTAHGHSEQVLEQVAPHPARHQQGGDHRRQCRHARGRAGADRRRRRRDQGRHRAGLDLHHAHRRRRRRAAAHRDPGGGRGGARSATCR